MKRSARRIAVRGIATLAIAAGLAAAVQPLTAHHAVTMYGRPKLTVITDEVVDIQQITPGGRVPVNEPPGTGRR